MLLSAAYIKREFSYDKHHSNADRIARLTIQFDDQPIDGRIHGGTIDDVLKQMPEIERIVKMTKVPTAMMTYQHKHSVINDFYMVTSEFLQVFDIPLLHGDKNQALQNLGQLMISESFAKQLFGDIDYDKHIMSEIYIESRMLSYTFFVSGIFKDLPETSHFQTDILLHIPDDSWTFAYTYLLLNKNRDLKALAHKITEQIEQKQLYPASNTRAFLMPLTDIHLRSHNLREMSINGNIYYVYLVLGANLLLLTVVLFNLWLNASLIFNRSRRYYQFLRLYGAASSVVFKDEALSALILGIISILTGIFVAFYISVSDYFIGQISLTEIIVLSITFLLFIVAVSLLPALKRISLTLFLFSETNFKPVRFSYSNVKWMLTAQYAMVMILVIVAFGINKQMNMLKNSQVGGNDRNILVMQEQPDQVQEKYALLKTELLKYPEIVSVTASFQLPGDAIRDAVKVKKENETDGVSLPVMVAGENFLPFFDIPLIAGRDFNPSKHDYKNEFNIANEFWYQQNRSEHIEEYIINQKACTLLGFSTPDEAVGQMVQIEQGTIDYFYRGIIVGVTDDFNYTGLYEETIPMIIMQRNIFLHCVMVRFAPDRFRQGKEIFETVWNEIYPDLSADYLFMNDIFGKKYHNEQNARWLVSVFSLLCFVVADLGLIIFMAFIVRRRTKEVGIRKINGASISEIIAMLNVDFIKYIAVAFVIAIPAAWYIVQRWLERFAYRTSLDWWIFAAAGFIVLILSVASVSLQSWRAASVNPVRALNSN